MQVGGYVHGKPPRPLSRLDGREYILRIFQLGFGWQRIENMKNMGNIKNSASTSYVVKKPFVMYAKKKEVERYATAIIRARALTYSVPYQQVAAVALV